MPESDKKLLTSTGLPRGVSCVILCCVHGKCRKTCLGQESGIRVSLFFFLHEALGVVLVYCGCGDVWVFMPICDMRGMIWVSSWRCGSGVDYVQPVAMRRAVFCVVCSCLCAFLQRKAETQFVRMLVWVCTKLSAADPAGSKCASVFTKVRLCLLFHDGLAVLKK